LKTAALAMSAAAQTDDYSVTLPSGLTLNGKQCDGTSGRCFFGVPYAEAPVGDLRFRPPQKYTTEQTGMAAKTHGNICV
jgi:carboxylesterase type B